MTEEQKQAINKELENLMELCKQLERVGLTTISNRIMVSVEKIKMTIGKSV